MIVAEFKKFRAARNKIEGVSILGFITNAKESIGPYVAEFAGKTGQIAVVRAHVITNFRGPVFLRVFTGFFEGGVELGNVNVIRCFSRFAGGGLKNHRSYGSFKSPIVGVGEREPEFGILMLDFGHFFAFFFKLAGFGDALHFKNRFVEFFISAHTAVSIHAFAKVSLVVQIITVGITVENFTVVGFEKVGDFFVHFHSAQ